jgi:Rrf2 family protein
MLELALRYDEGPVSSKEIAEEQEISQKYLESLMAMLRTAGLVRSIRGAAGGHVLARPPDRITLRDVFEALEGQDGFIHCTVEPSSCSRVDICVTQEVWAELYRTCAGTLESMTLQDLAWRAREKQQSLAAMYYI